MNVHRIERVPPTFEDHRTRFQKALYHTGRTHGNGSPVFRVDWSLLEKNKYRPDGTLRK